MAEKNPFLDPNYGMEPGRKTDANPFSDPDYGKEKGGLIASAKQSIGSAIKGAGQVAADFIPGVGQENAVKQYGQGVIDANPTAVKSLGDIADKPGMAVKEAVGNAAGSMGPMLGARALGMGITAAAPLTGPLAPITAAVGQGVSWLGPAAAAALPSFGGIREQQIKDDPTKADDLGAKARAAAGAAAVGAIESKFGPQEWALGAMTKAGRDKLAEKFAAKTLAGSVGKGLAHGAATEGAEELVQNPIEQIAAYQDPTTAANVQDTLFGGAMGAIGGGVLGGGFGGVSRVMGGKEQAPGERPPEVGSEDPAAVPLALPPPIYTGTPTDQMLQAEAERQNQVDAAQARANEIYQRRDAVDAARNPQEPPPDLSPVRDASAAQLDALRQQEGGEPDVPQTAAPDGRAVLDARRNAETAAGRAMTSPDDEIFQSTGAAEPPHRAMGIDPAAGPLSAGAAIAVDSGVHGQMQASAQAVEQPAGPLTGAAQDAGGRFVAGEKWSKPGLGAYTIESVSGDGKMAVANDRGDKFTIHHDAEAANGWRPEGREIGAQQDLAKAWNSMSAPERASVADRVGLPPVVARNVPRAGWESLNGDLQARIAKAMTPASPAAASPIEGADLGGGWTAFGRESGTAGVPRAQMPQIKAEHRGAMTNFMNARGVSHSTEEVPADSLRPTQAEFSPEKVKRAAGFTGGDRSILVSSDNYVLDGHHQWLAKREAGEPVKVIRLNAPIRDLIGLAHEFPSSTTASAGAARDNVGGQYDAGRAAASADDLRAMSQDAGWQEVGGKLIRDAAGNVSRTKWMPRAEWFRAGMEGDPNRLAQDIARFVSGQSIPVKSRRTIEGMMDWLDAQRGESHLDENASAYDFEAAGLGMDSTEEALLIGDIFAEAAPQDESAAMWAMGFTEKEIQDVIEQKTDQAGPRGAGKDDAGRAQEAGEVARSASPAQGEARGEGTPEGLTSYTSEDIARMEAAQRSAAAEAERTQREGDQKAQADAERDSFTLTGSDRAADVHAAQGQGGMFDAPADAKPANLKDGLAKIRKERAAQVAVTDHENGDTSIAQFEEVTDATEQPAVGNAPSPLEALFSDLNSDSTRKANKARKAAAKLPQAARIDYVQANFHDILIQMMEAGALEVNGATTLTEDNKPCL